MPFFESERERYFNSCMLQDPDDYCLRCGRDGHTSLHCEMSTYRNGELLSDASEGEDSRDTNEDEISSVIEEEETDTNKDEVSSVIETEEEEDLKRYYEPEEGGEPVHPRLSPYEPEDEDDLRVLYTRTPKRRL